MRDEDSDIETGNGEGQAYRSHWWPNMQVLKIPDANSKTKVILIHTYADLFSILFVDHLCMLHNIHGSQLVDSLAIYECAYQGKKIVWLYEDIYYSFQTSNDTVHKI